jgi:hypothetical protein
VERTRGTVDAGDVAATLGLLIEAADPQPEDEELTL